MNAKLILSWIGAAMIGGATVAVLGGAQRPGPRQVVAEKVVARKVWIQDEAGRNRIELDATRDMATIILRDARGKGAVFLSALKDGSNGVALYDPAGKTRVVLGFDPDRGPAFQVLDADGKPVASLP